jgi:hypothetical protein
MGVQKVREERIIRDSVERVERPIPGMRAAEVIRSPSNATGEPNSKLPIFWVITYSELCLMERIKRNAP